MELLSLEVGVTNPFIHRRIEITTENSGVETPPT